MFAPMLGDQATIIGDPASPEPLIRERCRASPALEQSHCSESAGQRTPIELSSECCSQAGPDMLRGQSLSSSIGSPQSNISSRISKTPNSATRWNGSVPSGAFLNYPVHLSALRGRPRVVNPDPSSFRCVRTRCTSTLGASRKMITPSRMEQLHCC